MSSNTDDDEQNLSHFLWTTFQGCLRTIMGMPTAALCELDRATISERTKSGLMAIRPHPEGETAKGDITECAVQRHHRAEPLSGARVDAKVTGFSFGLSIANAKFRCCPILVGYPVRQ